MFDQTLIESPRSFRKALPLAYLIEAALVAGLILVPLIRTEQLGAFELVRDLIVLPPPPLAARPAPATASTAPRKPRVTAEMIFHSPVTIPETIPHLTEEPVPMDTASPGVADGVPFGIPGGARDGVLGGVLLGDAAVPPPPPSSARSSKPRRVRAGGQVDPAQAIFQPEPEYPPLARMARIEGTVRLEAVIAADGTIRDLKILSGHPLLVKAALDAVARWRYQPTLLNGEPVEVLTEIEVHFRLAG
jgi:protein TonB